MNDLLPALPLLLLQPAILARAPVQADPGIDGATVEFAWPGAPGVFHDLETLHFETHLEADVVALRDDELALVHHPGRYQLIYTLADGVSAMAVVPVSDGIDAVAASTAAGLCLVRRNTGVGGAFTTATLTETWPQLSGLWAFPWLVSGVPGARIYGYDPVRAEVLRGELVGSVWSELAAIPVAEPLRDLQPIDWTDESVGLELAWLFDGSLFVTAADGSPGYVWYPVVPTDSMAVLKDVGAPRDVLAWVSTWAGQPVLYACSPTGVYLPCDLASTARTDLVAIDRDGDGRDDVVLPSATAATARVLERHASWFAPFSDGDTLRLTRTAGEVLQTALIDLGTAGDFDNDGTLDLFFGQQGGSASQYLGRPDYEERFRSRLEEGGGPFVTSTGGVQTVQVAVDAPFYREATTYHVQLMVLDWSTGLLDEVPLDDDLVPIDTAPKTTITSSFPESRLPALYALFMGIAQVDVTGTEITRRYPTRWLYDSPFPWIDEALSQQPYPPNTDPLDPGNGTGTRAGSRLGSSGAGSTPPP